MFAESESGKITALSEIDLRRQGEPKLLFMHIPKAAGTTVNGFLASHFSESRCATHLEANSDWMRDPRTIRTLDFVSGHVSLPVLASKLNLSEYFTVTVVREPLAQLASHIAWVRRLADPDEEHRRSRHPQYIQVLARKLEQIDLSDPVALEVLPARLEGPEIALLDNCQVRYFCGMAHGRPVREVDFAQARAACGEFDRIGLAERVEDFLSDVAEARGWKRRDGEAMENVSATYYGIDVTDRRFGDALEPLVRWDAQLLNHIRSSQDFRKGIFYGKVPERRGA